MGTICTCGPVVILLRCHISSVASTDKVSFTLFVKKCAAIGECSVIYTPFLSFFLCVLSILLKLLFRKHLVVESVRA